MQDFLERLPNDRWYSAEQDLWLKEEGQGWRVGANAMITSLGKFMVFYPKPEGTVLDRGDSLGVMETWKTAFGIASPFACRILESNGAVVRDIGVARDRPYDQGWLFLLKPTESLNPTELFKTYDQYMAWLRGPGAGQFDHLRPPQDPSDLIYDPLRGM